MRAVLAFSESPELAGEVSAAAALLAGSPGEGGALAIELDAPSGRNFGVPVLVVSADKPLRGSFELTADALSEVAKREGSSVTLIGATRFGREVAARLAVKTRRGVLSDVKDLRLEPGGSDASIKLLTGVKGAFAGKFNARVSSPTPCIATIPPGAYEAGLLGKDPVQSTETLQMTSATGVTEGVRRIESRAKPKNMVDLKSATIIVSAGRGFKRKEDLSLVEELAEAIRGTVGASRPLTSDLGWLGEERHVGLTGIYVRPNLYIAVGISGQLQHVAGIKDSRLIVAINKDKQAPIFQVADYGIVGDLYQVVPALLKAIEARKAT
jgi:electron transfer flavoprotein alpha subunit